MKKLIILLTLTFLLTGCVTVCVSENEYEYIDLFGNKGTANDCYDHKYGGLYCELGEDSVIQVSQYKLIESNSVCR